MPNGFTMRNQNNVSPVTKLSQDRTHFTQLSKGDPREAQQHSLTSKISTVSHIHANAPRKDLNHWSTQVD